MLISGSRTPSTANTQGRKPTVFNSSNLIHPAAKPCCCSVAESCPTLFNLLDCSMPGFPVLHDLLEFAQTHTHWVSDAIQPSRPLSPPSLPAFIISMLFQIFQYFPASGSFPMSQLFTSGGQSFRASASASASVLPMNIQDWFPWGLTDLISLLSKELSIIFSSTTVRRHQFFDTQPFLLSSSHIHTWLLVKPQLWLYGPVRFFRVI